MSKQAKRQPWLKWYPSDWRAEPRLKMVSRAARSLWVDLIGLMHEAEPYGFLMVGNVPLKNASLIAKALGDTEVELTPLLKELESSGVYSRVGDANLPADISALIPPDTRKGVIFSRKMLRDKAKATQAKEFGEKGGNPFLMGVNRGDNALVKVGDKPQKPEARSQKKVDATASNCVLKTNPTEQCPSEPLDAKTWLFRDGLDWLVAATGKAPSTVRGMIGKWRKDASEDVDLVRATIEAAQKQQPSEPIAWITAGIAARLREAAEPFEATDDTGWRKRLTVHRDSGEWPAKWGGTGPLTHEGHRLPSVEKIFAEFGFAEQRADAA